MDTINPNLIEFHIFLKTRTDKCSPQNSFKINSATSIHHLPRFWMGMCDLQPFWMSFSPFWTHQGSSCKCWGWKKLQSLRGYTWLEPRPTSNEPWPPVRDQSFNQDFCMRVEILGILHIQLQCYLKGKATSYNTYKWRKWTEIRTAK